jgi:phosphohistidine phosphatase
MKTILLIRHAEAATGSGFRDRDRPLTGKGRSQAPEMASRIKQRGLVPELIVASPAKRAQQTASLMADIWRLDQRCVWKDSLLYEGDVETYREVWESLPDRYGCVAVIAHNPTIGQLAARLSTCVIQAFPPAGVAAFRVQAETWAGCSPSLMQLAMFAVPGA